jgi:hypothetical protein
MLQGLATGVMVDTSAKKRLIILVCPLFLTLLSNISETFSAGRTLLLDSGTL